jgi:molybdenum cofactor synthesis domain-containing protein
LRQDFRRISSKSVHRNYSPIFSALRKFLYHKEITNFLIGTEYVDLDKAADRILAVSIRCPIDSPPFPRATVDGYAIQSDDTMQATSIHPVMLNVTAKINAGDNSRTGIKPSMAAAIATGGRIPKGADSVIMIENVVLEDERRKIIISDRLDKGLNISPKGNDLKKGQILLKEGTWLSAAEIGLIASVGISKILVFKKLKVAVLSTGSEVVEPGSSLGNASVFDSNRFMLFSMISKYGGEPVDLGICRDKKYRLREKIKRALKFDMILISGGSSVGEKDYVPEILNEIGNPGIIVRWIAMKPGSPTSLAVVNRKPVIVLPGYPVSAFIAFYAFGIPLFCKILKTRGPVVARQVAKLTSDVRLHDGMTTFIRVRIRKSQGSFLAEPISSTGSSLLSTLAYSDGMIIAKNKRNVREKMNMLHKGDIVDVVLLRNVYHEAYE